MKIFSSPAAAFFLICTAVLLISSGKRDNPISKDNLPAGPDSKIQVAILLDVSNSMDGLIEQAKAQLWNMVSVMGKAKCDNKIPQIEIALYEYGRASNNPKEGYVQQLSSFTTDLDKLSQTLFNIKTNGGNEYCGHVIYSSLTELNWDTAAPGYKVIFIAGNEDFLQGDILYTRACAQATKNGVIINTIYCGDKAQGIREHWNLGGECGGGSFSNINQDAQMEDIATPYDSVLFSLNDQLNETYIGYGLAGGSNFIQQREVDKKNYVMNKSVAAKRVAVKGKKELYKNTTWDLVDAAGNDSLFVTRVDMKTLPDSLQKKSRDELKLLVQKKTNQRGNIQKQISTINTKRELYIVAEKAKSAPANANVTLETQIEKTIKQQAKRFNIVIEN